MPSVRLKVSVFYSVLAVITTACSTAAPRNTTTATSPIQVVTMNAVSAEGIGIATCKLTATFL